MEIIRSIDIENTTREVLAEYMTAYCLPLPADFTVPSILIQQVGGTDEAKIDTFEITLDSRADNEATALENLRNAIGILKARASQQDTALAYITVNTSGSWGRDPVRPELAMCSARLTVVAHQETTEV